MQVVFLLGALGAIFGGVLFPLEQSLSMAAPAVIVEWHGSQLKGTPSQLTWSPDSTSLCLQTIEGQNPGKPHAYLVEVAAKTFHGLDTPPEWAATYWEWKSTRTPPGHPELVIQVDTLNKSGEIPTQSLSGDKAKNGLMENAVAAQNEAGSTERRLTLKGETIGRYVDQPLVPGMTFGWSPQTLHAVAYANVDGRLAILDFDQGRVDVNGTKDVLLPAWAPDGASIAFVQKTGRRDYALLTVGVTHP
jgi:hypothetical protein